MNGPSYSSRVDLRIIIGDEVLPLDQVGPSHAILTGPAEYPPTDAKIEVVVDDKVTSYEVFLYDGISVDSPRIEFY